MITDIEKAIRDYLPDILHMSLATCANNKPWVCEVHFVYDDKLNIYFRSLKTRRHSQEIAQNPYVAGNIVKQHPINLAPRGVYFEGKAEMLKNSDEINSIIPQFVKRLGADPSAAQEALKDNEHKVYKITVSNYYLFDAQESKPSQKYELPWNR